LIVVWLRTAIRSRYDQLDYIAEANPAAALRIDGEIDRHIDLLERNPGMGRIGRVPTTRELVVGRTPFILIYRLKRSRIEILRVLHGAQLWPPTREAQRDT
jgi:toxin ParE1/3/4